VPLYIAIAFGRLAGNIVIKNKFRTLGKPFSLEFMSELGFILNFVDKGKIGP
jgi:hypothetical protein